MEFKKYCDKLEQLELLNRLDFLVHKNVLKTRYFSGEYVGSKKIGKNNLYGLIDEKIPKSLLSEISFNDKEKFSKEFYKFHFNEIYDYYDRFVSKDQFLARLNLGDHFYFIDLFESFEKRKGFGRELFYNYINEEKKDLFLLISANNSLKFYEKLGFKNTKFYVGYNPIMIFDKRK